MNAEEGTGGMRSDGLAGLLGIGLEAEENGGHTPDERREARLRARLAGTLPLKEGTGSALPGLSGGLVPADSASVGQLLLDSQTPLEAFQWAKEYAKRLPEATRLQTDRAAATAIYFAAIAGALLFHNEKITTHSYADLADHFGSLIEKRWMDPKLVKHFAKARKVCCKEAR